MGMVTSVIRRKSRVQIDLDGRFYINLRMKDFEKFPVQEGDVLDEQAFEDRLSAAQYEEAYEDALTLLDYSQRTAAELRRKLLDKGYAPPAADAVVQRLTEIRLIDDATYAQRIVESIARKPVGVYAAKRKLRAKGFDEDDADDALEQLDDEQQSAMALALARKLLPRYEGKGDARAVRNKLSQALARRGFSWEIVKGAIDAVMDEDEGMDW